jgi:hypothetical protein
MCAASMALAIAALVSQAYLAGPVLGFVAAFMVTRLVRDCGMAMAAIQHALEVCGVYEGKKVPDAREREESAMGQPL